jgi:hypothetical protein
MERLKEFLSLARSKLPSLAILMKKVEQLDLKISVYKTTTSKYLSCKTKLKRRHI